MRPLATNRAGFAICLVAIGSVRGEDRCAVSFSANNYFENLDPSLLSGMSLGQCHF